ncbi:MAG: ethanolamine ammonia-lyase reactivating factor EutA [Candidatus Thorarchaeota archaeon]|nr:ethanolamine ammonia-lyase reactivating factor EutA [Candidatus Thorarchaeota archaeon]
MTLDTVQNLRSYILTVTRGFFEKNFNENAESMSEFFKAAYSRQLEQYESEDSTEVDGIRRLIVSFRPALSSVLKPSLEFDTLMTMIQMTLKAPWEGAHRRNKKSELKRQGPIMPGGDHSVNVSFYCSICGVEIEVTHEMKKQILSSDEEVELPQHCDRDVIIRITQTSDSQPVEEVVADEPFEPIELLMGHVPADSVEYMTVMSVGIDIGSSTSHLIFSRLTLKREISLFNISNRFVLVNREIIYQSPIIFTPLLDRYTIDIEAVIEFCEEQYRKAGISPEMVETGAVIVTGETAKKKNAEEIVERLSSKSGKFVSAAAGVNLESLLGAMGSGIVAQSGFRQKNILHVDVGGGTSNMSIASRGQVLSTSCINVGGRLLGIDDEFKIWRIDGPTQFVMKELGMNYRIGDTIPEQDVRAIAREYAKTLVEVMRGPATSVIAKELMMADDLDFTIPIDEVSFSGGVAEMIYGNGGNYDDIGKYLAQEIRNQVTGLKLPIVEPENKIRATVIGAGSFSLSVSGSTTFYYDDIDLPITNVPVIPVHLRNEEFDSSWFEEEIRRAFKTFDIVEGNDLVALYFSEQIHHQDRFKVFAKAIEKALPNSVEKKKPIILIFAYDFAKVLGINIRNETTIQNNLLCLDELNLEAGDWIDIGAPLKSTQSFPVTVKSLVFNQNKEYFEVE